MRYQCGNSVRSSICLTRVPTAANFLPSDAVRKRGLCCRPMSDCPSVYLSRSCIVSIRLNISSNFFLGPVARHYSSLTPSAGTQYQGKPLQRGRKIHCSWDGKTSDFRLKLPFISETVYEIGPWLLWNVNRKS